MKKIFCLLLILTIASSAIGQQKKSYHIADKTKWSKYLKGYWELSGEVGGGKVKMKGDVIFHPDSIAEMQLGLQFYMDDNTVGMTAGIHVSQRWYIDNNNHVKFEETPITCKAQAKAYIPRLQNDANDFKKVCDPDPNKESPFIGSSKVTYFSPTKILISIEDYQGDLAYSIVLTKKS